MVAFSSTAVVVGAGLVPFVPRGTVRFTGCAARGGVVAWRLTPPANSMREINGVRKIFTLSQLWLVPGPRMTRGGRGSWVLAARGVAGAFPPSIRRVD